MKDLYYLDCENWDNSTCLIEIGKTLQFPNYYGRNLDAFNDCLSDIVPDNEGVVLVFKNFDKFNVKCEDMAYHLLDIIQRNSWRLLVDNQKKLMAFLHSNDPQLHIQSVGAYLYFGIMSNGLIRAEDFNESAILFRGGGGNSELI
ncbi:barstar family protein [Paenibacillus radicis (ex Xue et al. 2023)]|uniref:Barstar family protein n=1 Tax=Paenibacillus radicis (ex Xue et al. 2023) TaxID=2972489 RepID=A0ABT1YNF6_9BACL|nr:barstar family protein [Paenibacillus radicis (ex Xue et al. 2023)]MCR8633525.1 barstar family protein [Paenibacillus radicis (ex Xue et al. 2023)]